MPNIRKPLPDEIEAFDPQSEALHVVIETPKGSPNKFDYDPERGIFKLGGVLPAGASFPFDFGFVPSTLGEDGDPLDVLVLMDAPAFAGCLVPSRLIGAVEARQTERDGTTMRNDRLIAVADNSHAQRDVRSFDDLSDALLDEIEYFFVSYNTFKGKTFEVVARSNVERARELVQEGQQLRDKQLRPKKPRSSTRTRK
jgi:inorganic pyrophosphatase